MQSRAPLKVKNHSWLFLVLLGWGLRSAVSLAHTNVNNRVSTYAFLVFELIHTAGMKKAPAELPGPK